MDDLGICGDCDSAECGEEVRIKEGISRREQGDAAHQFNLEGVSMKVIVAGSRTITSYYTVEEAIQNSGFQITELVSGTARGVDRLAEQWATNNKIAIKRFPADWNQFGRGAGYRRNEQMANYAEALIAVWDNSSPGTRHMIEIAKSKGLKIFLFVPERRTA